MDIFRKFINGVVNLMHPDEWAMLAATLLLFIVIFYGIPLLLEATWWAYSYLIG